MRILACGSRKWTDGEAVTDVLNGFYCRAMKTRRPGLPVETEAVVTLIEGQCPSGGADAFAAAWAKVPGNGVHHLPFPADWAKYGKAAGPIRNQQMVDALLEGDPEEQRLVVAFKDGFLPDVPDGVEIVDPYTVRRPRGGTEDMVRRAKAAGIPVYVISHG